MDNNSASPSASTLDEKFEPLSPSADQHEERFSAFIKNAVEAIWRLDFNPPVCMDDPEPQQIQHVFDHGVYTEANNAAAIIFGLTKGKDVIDRPLSEFMDQSDPRNKQTMQKLVQNRFLIRNLLSYEQDAQGNTLCIVNNITPGIDGVMVEYIWGASLDITELMSIQEELDNSRKVLASQKQALEDKNAALKELITHIEMDKKEFKERIIANIQQVILPSLDRITLNPADETQIEQLRGALQNITSSFGLKITDSRLNLTPREIEVCDLVKNRLTSKEIARILKIAPHTVEKHRRTSRKKLGLTNQGINLQTHLHLL